MTEDFKPGKPEFLAEVEVDFEHEDTPKKRLVGRPKGALNKATKDATIFREQMAVHFEQVMRKDFKYILARTVDDAKDGDMKAIKMLMDRVVPVGKAVDLTDNKGTPLININIGSLTKDDEDTTIVSKQ